MNVGGPARHAAVGLALALGLAGLSAPTGSAESGQQVGVVRFYAPTPLAYFSGLFPEQFAAEDLSAQLARSSDARFTVIPRAAVARAETAMGWRELDALSFERLKALGGALNADWLVVGWIPLLWVGGKGVGRVSNGGGDGTHDGDASVVVQVFNTAQGRILGQVRRSAYALGMVRTLIAEEALHQALQPTVPFVLDAVTRSR